MAEEILPTIPDNPAQLSCWHSVDQLCSTGGSLGPHAHVQWTILMKLKTSQSPAYSFGRQLHRRGPPATCQPWGYQCCALGMLQVMTIATPVHGWGDPVAVTWVGRLVTTREAGARGGNVSVEHTRQLHNLHMG